MQLVLATRNQGKVREMQALLKGLPLTVTAASDLPGVPEVEEDEPTLEGNARKKAAALYDFAGLAALADDTGLEVTALGGRPGVHSARYAGPACDDAENRRKLLNALHEQPERSAQFRTVAALIIDGELQLFEGVCRGTIATAERGSGGFGYDALFIPEGFDRTFAEMNGEEKNAVSHRGRAMRAVADYLREYLGSAHE